VTRKPDRWDVLLGTYAVIAALAPPLTAPAVVAVAVPGAVAVALRARRPVAPLTTAARPRAAAVQWGVVAALLAAWWTVAFAWGNDAAHPTLSLLLDPVLDTYPGRLAGWLLWLAAGRWLVTR
jgi:hypothetical protein